MSSNFLVDMVCISQDKPWASRWRSQMRRREFVSLAGSAVMWPLAAASQQPMPVIGILDPDVSFIFDAFVRGMSDLGYVEGQNVAYVRKLAHGRPESLP